MLKQALPLFSILVFSLLFTSTASAQLHMYPVSNGPTAPVRCMDWSPDGTRLYVGGRDKAVHVWDIGWNKTEVEAGLPDRYTYVGAIRWEAVRSRNGEILAISVSPDGESIAIAGKSAHGVTSYICIADTNQLRINGSLPKYLEEPLSYDKHHHPAFEVCSLSWESDSKHLISMDDGGNVFRWDVESNSGSRIFLPAPRKTIKLKFTAAYLSPSTYIATSLTSRGLDCSLYTLSPSIGQLRPIKQLSLSRLNYFPISVNKASTETFSFVDIAKNELIIGDTRSPARRITTSTILKTSISKLVASRVVYHDTILVSGFNEQKERRPVVELWKLAQGKPGSVAWTAEHVSSGPNLPIFASSPTTENGKHFRIAIFDSNQQKTLVYRLDKEGNAGQKMLPVIITSNLQASQKVSIIEDDKNKLHLAILNQTDSNSAPNATSNNSITIKFDETPSKKPFEVSRALVDSNTYETNLAANSVQKISNNPLKVAYSESKIRKGIVIPQYDWERYGDPSAIKMILRKNTCIGFAVASSYTNEVLLFSVDGKLLRRYRDHDGTVLDIDYSLEHKLLVTVASDYTTKLWPLPESFEITQSTNEIYFGANFKITNNQLVVSNITRGGPFDVIGVRPGDVIESLQVQESFTTEAAPTPFRANDSRLELYNFLLHSLDPRISAVGFKFQKSADSLDGWSVSIAPAWHPIFTFCMSNDDEWIAFKPSGKFIASQARGAELLGIRQSRASVDRQPRLLTGLSIVEQFKATPEDEADFNILVTTPNRSENRIGLEQHLESVPEILSIASERINNSENLYSISVQIAGFDDSKHEVSANMQFVRYVANSQKTLTELDRTTNRNVTTFVFDGLRQKDFSRGSSYDPTSAAWQRFDKQNLAWEKYLQEGVVAYGPMNRFEASVLDKKSRNILDNKATFVRGSDSVTTENLKLSVVMLSCHDYQVAGCLPLPSNARKRLEYSFERLDKDKKYNKYSLAKTNENIAWRKEIKRIQDSSQHSRDVGKVDLVNWIELLDHSVTHSGIESAFNKIEDVLFGDPYSNIVVVYIGGHGTDPKEQLNRNGSGSFRFVPCSMSDETDLIGWDAFSRFSELNARVIYVVSACYAGEALEDAFYDIKRTGACLVASAPSTTQSAISNTPGEEGEYFTLFLSKAISEQLGAVEQENRNGSLFADLSTIVLDAAQKTTSETLQNTTITQRPCYSPDLQQLFFPLVSAGVRIKNIERPPLNGAGTTTAGD